MNIYHVAFSAEAPLIVSSQIDGPEVAIDLQADPVYSLDPYVFRLENTAVEKTNFFRLNNTALVYDARAAIVMDQFIEYDGELFTIEVEGVSEPLTLVNIVGTCNPVNRNNSTVIEGNWQDTLALNQLDFHRSRVFSLSSLFKIPELDYRPILTFSAASTETYCQEHDFFRSYTESGLTGLEFNLIWSDNSG